MPWMCPRERGQDRKGGCGGGEGKLQGSKGNIAPHPCQQVMGSFSSGQWRDTWTFQNDLFLDLDVLSSGETKYQSEGQPHLGCREPGALAKPPQLPLQYRRQVLA